MRIEFDMEGKRCYECGEMQVGNVFLFGNVKDKIPERCLCRECIEKLAELAGHEIQGNEKLKDENDHSKKLMADMKIWWEKGDMKEIHKILLGIEPEFHISDR